MACCMAALVFVYQLIHGWQRFRRWCGWPARAAGRFQQRLRTVFAPLPRGAWIVLVAFELGVGSALIDTHADHLQRLTASLTEGTVHAVERLCSTRTDN